MSNSQAFARVAAVVRRFVDERGGVLVIDRETLWRDIVLDDSTLEEYGPMLREHLTLSFSRVRLAARPYSKLFDELLIYDTGRHDEDTARYAHQNEHEEALVLA